MTWKKVLTFRKHFGKSVNIPLSLEMIVVLFLDFHILPVDAVAFTV